jgi:hypothetical protein
MASGPLITETGFFHPSFNAAIFDGPLRLYFSQPNESLALSIYIRLKSQLSALRSENLFVLLYGVHDEFLASIQQTGDSTRVGWADASTAEPLAFLGEIQPGGTESRPALVVGVRLVGDLGSDQLEERIADLVSQGLSNGLAESFHQQVAAL